MPTKSRNRKTRRALPVPGVLPGIDEHVAIDLTCASPSPSASCSSLTPPPIPPRRSSGRPQHTPSLATRVVDLESPARIGPVLTYKPSSGALAQTLRSLEPEIPTTVPNPSTTPPPNFSRPTPSPRVPERSVQTARDKIKAVLSTGQAASDIWRDLLADELRRVRRLLADAYFFGRLFTNWASEAAESSGAHLPDFDYEQPLKYRRGLEKKLMSTPLVTSYNNFVLEKTYDKTRMINHLAFDDMLEMYGWRLFGTVFEPTKAFLTGWPELMEFCEHEYQCIKEEVRIEILYRAELEIIEACAGL